MRKFYAIFWIIIIFYSHLICQDKRFFHHLSIIEGLTSQDQNKFIFKDSKGFVWISTVADINLYDGKEVKSLKPSAENKPHLDAFIPDSPFYEDKKHNIWFSTYHAVYRYNRDNNSFLKYHLNENSDYPNGIYNLIYLDTDTNNFWVTKNDSLHIITDGNFQTSSFIGNLKISYGYLFERITLGQKKIYYLINPLQHGFEFTQISSNYKILSSKKFLPNFKINSAYLMNFKEVILGTDKGIIIFNLEDEKIDRFDKFNGRVIGDVNDIIQINSKELLIGTESDGLLSFNINSRQFIKALYNFDGKKSTLFNYPVDNLYLDNDGMVWVATKGQGIFYTKLSEIKFKKILQRKNEDENSKPTYVRSITEDYFGYLWVLTNQGIYVLNEEEKILPSSKNYQNKNVPFVGSFPYWVFADEENTVWVSDFSGLYFKSSKESFFKKIELIDTSYSNNQIVTTIIKEAQNGTKLFGSTRGIWMLEKSRKKIFPIKKTENHGAPVTWIEENLLTQQFLFCIDQKKILIGKIEDKSFQLDTSLVFLPFVNYMYHDTISQRYWMATVEGLFWISYDKDRYKLGKDFTLNHSGIMGVLREDDSDNLWLSSNRGIIKYNFKTGEQRVYGLVDGVQSLEFNFFASYKSKSGKLLFGGVNGLNIFDPKTIKDDAKPANPTITSMLVNDEPPEKRLVCSETGNQNISYIKHLEFPNEQNTLSFNFAALDYVNPDANQFRYRMKGQDDKWVFSDTKNFARYANLPPKSYVFEVDATNSDGIWSENPAQLRITIHPPWYLTWYAYLGYFLIGIGGLFAIYKFQINQRLKQAEAHRLKELDRIKTALYTNITHEFRTPLTIILGMADQIKNKPQRGFQQGLEMIRRSGQNLLNLVNQMLDLSKVESGNMEPQYVQGDIIQFLEYIVESFQSFAASKQINVTFYNEVPSLMMDYDIDKLQTIVTNLLSNATKFTPEKGKIIVHVQQLQEEKEGMKNWCQLKIKDNGIGIDEKDLPHIFDRFYQIDDSATRHSGGTGIGLALTKELVELMDGSITVQSQLNKGTEFTIILPVKQTSAFVKDFSKDQLAEKLVIPEEEILLLEEEQAVDKATLPLVLIIEDNLDVITYLQSCLEEQYRVSIALDGQAGIEKALEIIPDIIITDVMMPLKDGYEVCEVLKAAEQTSHIPIIMLTAKAQIEAKIEGLSKGADAYLSKPFHQKELEVRLAQLLVQRKKLQAFYSQQSIAPSPKIEDPFVQKVIDLVESDLAMNLNLEQFSKSLGMSRAQVFRKIKAITGFSTSNFIQRIRLKNGHHLLLTTQLNVAEIAYSVGFKDPAYFSRSFLKVYKTSPTQLREAQENNQKKQ